MRVEGIRKAVTTTKMGEYWRLLTPGKTYRIYVTKDGYRTSEKKTVTLPGNAWPPKLKRVMFRLDKE